MGSEPVIRGILVEPIGLVSQWLEHWNRTPKPAGSIPTGAKWIVSRALFCDSLPLHWWLSCDNHPEETVDFRGQPFELKQNFNEGGGASSREQYTVFHTRDNLAKNEGFHF